jgi:hypothetical protein
MQVLDTPTNFLNPSQARILTQASPGSIINCSWNVIDCQVAFAIRRFGTDGADGGKVMIGHSSG